jgi:hypothetical protein
MNETFNLICQDVIKLKQIDISRNEECFKMYKKIANKHLDKYKKRENNDLESCKRDIREYSVKYFCKKLHGKPPGKIGETKEYSSINQNKDESTIPVPTERDLIDLKQQQTLLEKKTRIYRNIFSSDTRKILFSVNTLQRDSISTDPKGTYTIDLQSKNIVDLKNVISFNLVKALVPNVRYTINDSNFDKLLHDSVALTLKKGVYTVHNIGTCFQSLGPKHSSASPTFSYNSNGLGTEKDGKFSWSGELKTSDTSAGSKSIARIFGLKYNSTSKIYTSTTTAAFQADTRANHFFDIEVAEIPSIACYQTEHSKNIVARINVNSQFGGLDEYTTTDGTYIDEKFQPQRLNKITIRLLDEFGDVIDLSGVESYFTFEAVVLKNVPDLGIVLEN